MVHMISEKSNVCQQLESNESDGYALALCGGGGKGAYQIGVWKALDELGIFNKIKAVSGTSVGALNAVLMAIGDFDNAKKIWNNIEKEDLLSINENMDQGLCSREGLISVIKNVPLSELRFSIPVYINIHDIDSDSTRSIQINQLPENEIVDYLLASSAMPIVYGPVNIQEKKYIDGGFTEAGNVPIDVLYKNGYRNIIVSALKMDFSLYNIYESTIKNPYCKVDIGNRYPNTEFTVLQPRRNIGGLVLGTLDFSKTGVLSRMVDGYLDTKKILNKEKYIMKKDYTTINSVIRDKMRDLFHNREDLKEFVECADFSHHNTPWPVVNGGYKTIVEIDGWTLQQGPVQKNHYRLVDHNSMRQAWVLDPEELLTILDRYEAAQKKL